MTTIILSLLSLLIFAVFGVVLYSVMKSGSKNDPKISNVTEWYVQTLGASFIGKIGSPLDSKYGKFNIQNRELLYTPDGMQAPTWKLPIALLRVRKNSLLMLKPSNIEIITDGFQMKCVVSREHINKFVQNDLKKFRQQSYADEFIRVMASNGAVIIP